MYFIGICDDGINTCTNIEEMILLYGKTHNIKIETEVWYTGESLCEYLKNKNIIDILFLDIELYKIYGIEVAEFIRNYLNDRRMQIIYISGITSYAQKLFKTQPMDFLIKPITQEAIDETLDLAIKILNKINEKFQYHNGKEVYYIFYRDIMYFSSDGRKIVIMTAYGEKKFYGKLKEISKKLPVNFIAIHQSFIVNQDYIRRYTYEFVELINGTILTISRVHRKQVREKLMKER